MSPFKGHVILRAWTSVLLQACMLMADDMMDGSVTRRGNPCWYRPSPYEPRWSYLRLLTGLTHIHTCTYTCIPTCMHAYIHAYMHTCIHTYIHACMHACMHAYIHTYVHIYLYTYAHAYYTILYYTAMIPRVVVYKSMQDLHHQNSDPRDP